jgi:hypothetical protein
MTTRFYNYSRNARAAARKAGLDPDTAVRACDGGIFAVDFGGPAPAADLAVNDVAPRSRNSSGRASIAPTRYGTDIRGD